MNDEKTLEQILEEDALGNSLASVAAMTLPELETFKEQWHELLEESVIDELGEPTPTRRTMPCIVFYSADWCAPCWTVKPTLLQLAPHFLERTSTPVFYFSDDKVHQSANVSFVPIIVAYFPPDEEFPEGRRVESECGETTEEFWKNLNLLITLGSGFQVGPRGKLVCTDEKCSIEPVKE